MELDSLHIRQLASPIRGMLAPIAAALAIAGCATPTAQTASSSATEPSTNTPDSPFAIFPSPEEIGDGWQLSGEPFSDQAELEASGDTLNPDDTFESEYATIEEMNTVRCDTDSDFTIGPSGFDDTLSASYESPSFDRVHVTVHIASDERRDYSFATEDYLARCISDAILLPDPNIGGATNTRQYQADPITGSPKVIAEVDNKIVNVFLFSDTLSSDRDIDLVAITQLIVDRA